MTVSLINKITAFTIEYENNPSACALVSYSYSSLSLYLNLWNMYLYFVENMTYFLINYSCKISVIDLLPLELCLEKFIVIPSYAVKWLQVETSPSKILTDFGINFIFRFLVVFCIYFCSKSLPDEKFPCYETYLPRKSSGNTLDIHFWLFYTAVGKYLFFISIIS